MIENEVFYEGQEVQYKWTNNGKWHNGRIKKIEYIPDMISHYQIEKFVKNAKTIDWQTVVDGIDRGKDEGYINTNGKDIYKYEDMWCPVKWFSKNYIRPIEK